MNIEFINITEKDFIEKYKFIYKYVSFEESLKMFQKNCLRFTKPSKWPDPYEKFFYECDYKFPCDSNTKRIPNQEKLVATCFTHESTCEASWKMYGQKSIPVKISFKIEDLLTAIKGTPGSTTYIGVVNYCSTNLITNEVKKCISRFASGKLSQKEWFNVLLYKRTAFKYEKEVRLFTIVDKEIDIKDDEYFLSINNLNVLCDNITISPNASEEMADTLKIVYKNLGIKTKHSYLYKNIKSNTIVLS